MALMTFMVGLLSNASVMVAANGIFTAFLALGFLPLTGNSVVDTTHVRSMLGVDEAECIALIMQIVMSACVSVASVQVTIVVCISKTFVHAYTPNNDVVEIALTLIYRLLPIIDIFGLAFDI